MVAAEAGVDQSTASRVLNNQLGSTKQSASSGTVEKVKNAARRLGYQPNPYARSLRTSKTNQIGVLVPTLTDIVLATIYEGFEEAANLNGFSTYVSNSLDDPERRAAQTEMMLSRHPDALVFGDADFYSDFLAKQREKGVKFCLVSRRSEGFPSATNNDFLGGQLAAQHLIDLNLTDVVVLAGKQYASTSIDRTSGFLKTFEDAGIEVDPQRIVYGPFDTTGGRTAMHKVLESGVKPRAVFATNDFAAIGAMSALQDFELSAGNDVGIIGFNDVPLAAAIPTPLSSISVPHREMGRQAFKMIEAILNDEPVNSVQVTPELKARRSTLEVR